MNVTNALVIVAAHVFFCDAPASALASCALTPAAVVHAPVTATIIPACAAAIANASAAAAAAAAATVSAAASVSASEHVR